MAGDANGTYVIEVAANTRQVLDLLTRRREFSLFAIRQLPAEHEQEVLEQSEDIWCELCGTAAPGERAFLYANDPDGGARSREGNCGMNQLRNCWQRVRFRDGSHMENSIEYPTIGELYGFAEHGPLRCHIPASSEAEANRVWLRDMLRLGADPGKRYASDDFSSLRVRLRGVSGDGEGAAYDQPVPADIAEFEVYDRLRGKLERAARSREIGYGDDVLVEYSISSEAGCARYCATEFYSNHNWSCDPANLLVVRFSAEIAPGACDHDEIRTSHPTKVTWRKATGERFLVDEIVMENDVKTKFSSGRGKDKRPNEIVSADRAMDNAVDFNSWIDMHRKEIELL